MISRSLHIFLSDPAGFLHAGDFGLPRFVALVLVFLRLFHVRAIEYLLVPTIAPSQWNPERALLSCLPEGGFQLFLPLLPADLLLSSLFDSHALRFNGGRFSVVLGLRII